MKYAWLMFVGGAVLTWGAYVVTIDHGRTAMFGPNKVPGPVAAMRAFLFIGLAYFVMGVVVPLIYLSMNKPDPARWPNDPGFLTKGVLLSTIAGILGAAGALSIVFAVGRAREVKVSPAAVASLVFCFAPIVNVLISMIIEPPAEKPSPWFFAGILMAAVGAGMVLYYKPEPAAHGSPAAPQGFPVVQREPGATQPTTGPGTQPTDPATRPTGQP
jgi:hypothetical protein